MLSCTMDVRRENDSFDWTSPTRNQARAAVGAMPGFLDLRKARTCTGNIECCYRKTQASTRLWTAVLCLWRWGEPTGATPRLCQAKKKSEKLGWPARFFINLKLHWHKQAGAQYKFYRDSTVEAEFKIAASAVEFLHVGFSMASRTLRQTGGPKLTSDFTFLLMIYM